MEITDLTVVTGQGRGSGDGGPVLPAVTRAFLMEEMAPPLEVREVRKEAVGVCVDVVAVGRLHIPKIEQGRWHEARGVTAVRDETRGSEAQDEDAEAGEGGEGDVSGPTLLRVRRQLEARALEERTRREEPRGAEMEPRGAEMEPRWSRGEGAR